MDLWAARAPELYVKTLEHLMLTGVSTGAAISIRLKELDAELKDNPSLVRKIRRIERLLNSR